MLPRRSAAGLGQIDNMGLMSASARFPNVDNNIDMPAVVAARLTYKRGFGMSLLFITHRA